MLGVLKIGVLSVAAFATAAGCVRDRGYGNGPYYDQGPVLQPGYQPGPVVVPGPGAQWAFLGQTVVNFQGERESIGCDPRNSWRRLQLTVSDGAVELYGVRVNYNNPAAAPYDVPVRNYVLTPQNPTVVIELPGEVRRNVTRIDFSYRAVDNNRRPTRLTVTAQ